VKEYDAGWRILAFAAANFMLSYEKPTPATALGGF